jgi:hypothetical protein
LLPPTNNTGRYFNALNMWQYTEEEFLSDSGILDQSHYFVLGPEPWSVYDLAYCDASTDLLNLASYVLLRVQERGVLATYYRFDFPSLVWSSISAGTGAVITVLSGKNFTGVEFTRNSKVSFMVGISGTTLAARDTWIKWIFG